MIYNNSMNMFQRQIIVLVVKMIIILKCSRIIKYQINLSIIFAIIAFNDITLIFIYSMKSAFVKMSSNYYFNNTSHSSYQEEE